MTDASAMVGPASQLGAGVDERDYPLSGYGGRSSRARVRVITYSRAGRVRRATAALAGWWAVALGAVFIPVAHFVLVPGFLAYGLYCFVTRVRAEQVAVDGKGTCPDCGCEQTLDVAGRWRVPRFISCRQCQRSLRIGP